MHTKKQGQDENNLCQIKTSDLRPVCYACEVYHLGVKEEKKNGSIKLRIMSANMILIEGFLTLLFLMHKY